MTYKYIRSEKKKLSEYLRSQANCSECFMTAHSSRTMRTIECYESSIILCVIQHNCGFQMICYDIVLQGWEGRHGELLTIFIRAKRQFQHKYFGYWRKFYGIPNTFGFRQKLICQQGFARTHKLYTCTPPVVWMCQPGHFDWILVFGSGHTHTHTHTFRIYVTQVLKWINCGFYIIFFPLRRNFV